MMNKINSLAAENQVLTANQANFANLENQMMQQMITGISQGLVAQGHGSGTAALIQANNTEASAPSAQSNVSSSQSSAPSFS